MYKIAIVTGASDGIGHHTAALLHRRGYKVYGLSRSVPVDNHAIYIRLDVSNRYALQQVLNTIYAREGRVDLLVCCAGVSLASPADMTLTADARYLFDVNFWGCVHAAALVGKRMKAARSGHIVLVSSLTGMVPLPNLSFYSASKAALIAYGTALANELRPFGVKASVVCPPGVRTAFTQKRKKYVQLEDSCQAPGLRKAIVSISAIEQHGSHPAAVARTIVRQGTKKRPAIRKTTGLSGAGMAAMEKLVPKPMLYAMERLLFA